MPGPTPTADLPTGNGPSAPELLGKVLDVVREALTDVIGAHSIDKLTIDLDSSFDRDLELESIEVVALNERLSHHYGKSIDFTAWLATKELDEIIALTVGDLVRFIASSVAVSTTTS